MVTLQANKFLGALTNLIAHTEYVDTLNEGGTLFKFLQSCRSNDVPTGDGKLIRAADILEVSDLDPTKSTLLSQVLPTVSEQYLTVENYKYVQLTVNKYLMAGAFLDLTAMSGFIGYLVSTMSMTKAVYIYKQLLTTLENYVPAKATQTVTVDLYDTTAINDPVKLNNAELYNAKLVEKTFLKIMREMAAPTAAYNDKGYTEIIDYSNMRLIIKGDENADIIVDALASLLNSGKITDEEKFGEKIVIPNGQFTKTNVSAWITHKKKIQYGFFYEVATSFFDASNLNTNQWLHFSYYIGTVEALPAVLIKLTHNKPATDPTEP